MTQPANKYGRSGVKIEPFAAIIKREVARRGGPGPIRIDQWGGYQAGLADEIAASGLMSLDAARRRIWQFLNAPVYESRRGTLVEQQVVDLDTADKILSALDLNYLWHTELADAVIIATCGSCGEPSSGSNPDCSECRDRASKRKSKDRAKSRVGRTAGAGGRNASSPKRGRVRRAPAPPQRKAA